MAKGAEIATAEARDDNKLADLEFVIASVAWQSRFAGDKHEGGDDS